MIFLSKSYETHFKNKIHDKKEGTVDIPHLK